MLVLYSLLLYLGFVLMLPLFLLRREKYASGFRQRLGNYPEFKHDGRDVIWLHCVSVGETNAARPLVDSLHEAFPDHRLVISTTTKTGQELARRIFTKKADAVFYFPFDFKLTVRRALANYKPSLVLLMETEIWPRFMREAKHTGAKIAIVNGRLSQRSFERYRRVSSFVKTVLADVDLASMQADPDAKRIIDLGIDENKVTISGNLKFDQLPREQDSELAAYFRERFGLDGEMPIVVAASTHDPEENWVLDVLEVSGLPFRLVLAPRHPERFPDVEKEIHATGYSYSKRSDVSDPSDTTAEVILLDSIGELRAMYQFADIVFVGGSLIPHGGQSILEPAVAGKAIITGPYTDNFAAVTKEFVSKKAIVQLERVQDPTSAELYWNFHNALIELLEQPERRRELGENALETMRSNRGATARTVEMIKKLTAA
jgi:3-deoxy-D-manno-octulosonic-acid transferase